MLSGFMLINPQFELSVMMAKRNDSARSLSCNIECSLFDMIPYFICLLFLHRQFDLRCPETARSGNPSNVLINLNAQFGHTSAEAKCLAINPLRPEMLAVGANDPYVRIYDRRMLSTKSINFAANDHLSFRLVEEDSMVPHYCEVCCLLYMAHKSPAVYDGYCTYEFVDVPGKSSPAQIVKV